MATTITLKDRQLIADGTLQATFALPVPLDFRPGQYAGLTIPGPLYSDDRGSQRFFSLINTPGQSEITIATRLSDSAFKRSLNEMRLGSEMQLDMVAGSFVLPSEPGLPLAFLAGGIGVTPFMSMLRYIRDNSLAYDITLFYSNRTVVSTAFLEELQAMEGSVPGFKLVAVMTDDPAWSGPSAPLNAQLIRDCLPDAPDREYYIAGPPGMVTSLLAEAATLGAASGRLHHEQFSGYR